MESVPEIEILKEDALGRVERIALDVRPPCVRRVACGGRIPGSALLARVLLGRECHALRALSHVDGVPRIVDAPAWASAPTPGRPPFPARAVLLRSWIEGVPLHRAVALPEDFFDHLDDLVARLHACGVCHNDLHKEQNILVDARGYPWLVDFQLASRHRPGSWLFQSRARDDLRHIEKHRRRYARQGREARTVALPRGRGHGIERSWIARGWRRFGKPVYVFVTRRVLETRDGEDRRATIGPWPSVAPPLGAPSARPVAPHGRLT